MKKFCSKVVEHCTQNTKIEGSIHTIRTRTEPLLQGEKKNQKKNLGTIFCKLDPLCYNFFCRYHETMYVMSEHI
jgi:hypothetical protein